ncbi:MAG: serine hydrolase [Planctomycetaceae bacterium]|nr:serine hydrolase [Planctomycetaceae bacterium]
MRSLTTLTLLFSIQLIANADVRLPSLFSDHLVLQQKTENTVWGFADPGEKVSVEASWGNTAKATANAAGRWQVSLETPSHGTGHSLTIRGNNTVALNDIAIGEVWLCAGQSNMGWATGNCFDADNEVANANAPNFRIFKSSREHWHEPLNESRDLLATWASCTPDTAATTSAVSYYFGKTLHEALGVPVGIIVQAYAGTPIEGWMPTDIQAGDKRTEQRVDALNKISRRYDRDDALKTWEQEYVTYEQKIAAGETMKNQFKQLQPPFITKPANLGHQYPSHIYNAMIHPIRPYGIRGAIWYQGERNSKNAPQAEHYRKQIKKLISYYRSSWHEMSGGNVSDDFPFILTQLPSWHAPQNKPAEGLESPWAVNREAMRLASKDLPNVGLVVSIDTGDAILLHPKNKRPIGIRHALHALENVYGMSLVGSGPRLRNQKIDGNRIFLNFDSIGSGLITANDLIQSGDPKLNSFAIAGVDGQWQWADAAILGNQVVLSSSKVKSPVAVRYAWAMNPSKRNLLYNREGLPASPFRTDDWPLFDPENEVIEVLKPKAPEGYVPTDWVRPAMLQSVDSNATRAKGGTPDTETQETETQETEIPKPENSESDNGTAPEITDLNAEDVSYALEKDIPDLETPFLSTSPQNRMDGIAVGTLEKDKDLSNTILAFAEEIAAGDHGDIDSLLLYQNNKLLFESYYRRGRINYPHYQMSITKSYTAMAIGRAIQLKHLSMKDLDRPVIDFLKNLDPSKLVSGANQITLAQALNMKSGIRIDRKKVNELRKEKDLLLGQGQIQAYLQYSAPIPTGKKNFKYQGSDPSIAMQVLDAVVPGSARDFIETELLEKLGITNFAWQDDVSGLPKSAAGSSMRSRDMLKWGMLVSSGGKWNDEQLIPADFVQKATDRINTNPQGTSYGYFWWRHDMRVGDRIYDCRSGRGAGGQFILMLPELDLIIVMTAHQQGMGKMLSTVPKKLLPAFARNK